MFSIGEKVLHPLHGVGVVETIEEKTILEKIARFSTISFQGDRLKIMVNLDQGTNLIRHLVNEDEIPKVIGFLKDCKVNLAVKSSERYNINLKKIKSGDIYQVAEVIRDLSDLSKTKKLSPKEAAMLKQTRRLLATEFSSVNGQNPDDIEIMLENICKDEIVLAAV
ncbi:MAG TPA: CarD family transcriptional regulator [Candidatus Xenobia bacterium]|jgi:CarD family transcriptional regulator